MNEVIVIFSLIGVVIFQQIFFLRQVQKLVDKLMSRSFQEYQYAQRPKETKVKVQDEIPEDLRVLQGFQM